MTKWCVKDGVSKMVCDEVPHCQPSATSAMPATQNEGGCRQVARLPRKTTVDVAKCHACHACHAKWRPAPGDQSAPKCATSASPVPQVPRLPCETKVDVSKCHACHAKQSWMTASAMPATRTEGGCRQVPRWPRKVARRPDQSQPSAPSATPATRNEGGCHQVPRLPRKTKVDVAKCHACHAKWRGAPGDQSAPPQLAQCPKCYACHAKRRWMSASATAATRNKVGCQQVPCLPREMKVDVAKCHAGHAKWRGAPTRANPVPQCHACHAKRRWMSPSATPATQFWRWFEKDGV